MTTSSQTNETLDVLDNIIDNIPQYIFWKDKNLIFRGCNRHFAAQFGLTDPKDIIGKTDFDFDWSPELCQKYRQDDQEILDTGITKLNFEEPQKQTDGSTKTVLVSKVPIKKDHEIVGILGIYTDITERKKMEKALQEAKEIAEQASLSKSAFIRNMGHDIRTPLNGIMGMAQLLDLKETDPEKKEYISGLLISSQSLADFLTSILEVVHFDNGRREITFEKMDLRLIIKNVMDLMLPLSKYKNITLTTEINSNIPQQMIGDAIRIQQILLNLVSNALKFTEKGEVKIIASAEISGQGTIELILSIQDTGIGIPKDKFNLIFEYFTKLKPSYKKESFMGCGIGLAFVKNIIEELNGKITLESHPHQGSTFTCIIPCRTDING